MIANSNVEGLAWTSSQLCELEIAEPFVKAEADRVVGGRAQTLSAKISLEQLIEFEGTARAKLRSLPPHTKTNGPLEFDSKSASLTFEITTTDKTPFGKHGGLFVEVEIPSGGGFSTGRAGNVLLQVNRPPKKEPAETKPQQDVAQANKPPAVAVKKSPSKSGEEK